MDKITINIKGTSYEVRHSIRAYMLFESAFGRAFEGRTTTDLVTLLLCAIWANNPGVSLTLDSLVDAIDEDPTILSSWSSYLADAISAQAARMAGRKGDQGSKDEPQTGKKKAKK